MINFFLGLLLVLTSASAAVAAPSAVRGPRESWKQARARSLPDFQTQARGPSAYDSLKDLTLINFGSVYDLKNNQDLMTIFEYVRDTRFITNHRSPISQRRISWLYPDDGCFVRAELMTNFIKEKRMPPTSKLFVFGDLSVRTKNAPGNLVRWWYHVAPIYRVGKMVYVLDPAIEPRRPLTVLEWRERVSEESDVRNFSLCSQHTFEPDDNCQKPTPLSMEFLTDYQRQFQSYEWERIVRMGRDPYKEL